MKIDKLQKDKMKVDNYYKINSKGVVKFSKEYEPKNGFYNRISRKALRDFKQILKAQD